MASLTFLQGIVRHPENFLVPSGANVSLDIPTIPTVDPLVLSFAHKDTSYLWTETGGSQTPVPTWVGPFSGGTTYYLWVDINMSTGIRSFGWSTIEPLSGSRFTGTPLYAPVSSSSPNGNISHWFDTNTRTMFYYNGLNPNPGQPIDFTVVAVNDGGPGVGVWVVDGYVAQQFSGARGRSFNVFSDTGGGNGIYSVLQAVDNGPVGGLNTTDIIIGSGPGGSPDGIPSSANGDGTLRFTPQNGWTETVRVFVSKYDGSSVFESMSINAPSFVGTNVGIQGAFGVGSLVYDRDGRPLKRTANNTFFTTEDVFATGLPSSTRSRIESLVVDGIAQTPLASYTMVRFSDFAKLLPLTPGTQPTSVYGLVEHETTTGALAQVVVDGVIRNPQWDWDFANQQIYVDNTGALRTVEGALPVGNFTPLASQVPVALAIDTNAILLRPARLLLSTAASIPLLALDDLTDVTVPSPVNGEALIYNSGTGEWESGTYELALYQLTDTALSATTGTLPTGRALVVGGSPRAWTDSGYSIPLTDGSVGQALITNGAGVVSFQNVALGLGSPLPLYAGDNVSELVNDAGYFNLSSQVDHDATTNFVANEHINHTSVTLTAGDGLTGGGDISVNRTFDVVGANSIVANANDIQLVNDAASPGNTKLYGTDGTGTKGWYDQPTGGGGSTIVYGGTDISVASGGSPFGSIINIDYPLDEAPDGSASAPTYSFLNETNSGWYRDDVQTVCLSVAGEDSICVINRNGSPVPATGSPDALVGIGIDLHVFTGGNGGDAQVRVETDASNQDAQVKLITTNGEWKIVNDSADDDLHFQWNDTDRFIMTDNPQLLGTDGSVTAPTYSFISDSNTGAYLPTAGEIAITTAGTQRVSIDATSIDVTPVLRGPDGTTGAPTYSFTNDTNTGIWRSGSGTINVSTTGVERLEIDATSIDATVPYRAASGTAGTPTYSFTGDPGVGLYLPASDTIGFVTGSVEKMQLLPTGILRSTVGNYATLLSNDGDIPNKAYVDSLAAGLDPKESVRCATGGGSPVEELTQAPYSGTYLPTGGSPVNSGGFVGVDLTNNIDGVVVSLGDRVLVKDQTDAKQNGIYVVTIAGASGALDRAQDQDGTPANEVSGGNFTFVESGSQAGSLWSVVWDGNITLNTDPVNWTQVSGAVSGATPALGGLTDVTDSFGPSGKDNGSLYGFIGNGSGSLNVVELTGGSPSILDALYLQSGDNISDLVNDAGYLTAIPGSPQIIYAGDNISLLNNDAGYITSAPGVGSPEPYLRLDTSNDPLTGTLTIDGVGSPQLALVANGDVVVNSQVRVSDGSVLTPTYSFSGESNTGWYRSDTTTVGLSIAGEESIIVVKPSTGSPSTALGSPAQYDLSVGIEMRLKNDADGDSRLVIETDASGYNAVLNLVTSNSTWSVTNSVSGGSPTVGADTLVVAKSGTTVAVFEDTGTPVTIRNHFYRESINVTGSPLEVVVTHSLGEQFVIVQVYDNSTPPQQVDPGTIELVDANNVRLTFSTAFTGTVVISG